MDDINFLKISEYCQAHQVLKSNVGKSSAEILALVAIRLDFESYCGRTNIKSEIGFSVYASFCY